VKTCASGRNNLGWYNPRAELRNNREPATGTLQLCRGDEKRLTSYKKATICAPIVNPSGQSPIVAASKVK
jgi:hypothetical protein